MIDSNTVLRQVLEYRDFCSQHNKEPTYGGLAVRLGVSPKTVFNVVSGAYNGRLYAPTAHTNRRIDNCDFEVVRALYR